VFLDAIGLVEYEDEISSLDDVGDNVDEGLFWLIRSLFLFAFN